MTEIMEETLYEVGQADPAGALAAAINRLAAAIERATSAGNGAISAPVSANSGPISAPTLTQLPPVSPAVSPSNSAETCPIHRVPWKLVPAGISKKTGNPYSAFRACTVAGCDQRPR